MHLKRALSIYLDHFLIILLLFITIVFPLQLVAFTFSSQSFTLFGFSISSIIISTVIQLFILNIVQVPFVYLASKICSDQEVKIGKLYSTFVMMIVPVSIMNIYYFVSIMIGTALFIIPGVFMFILAFLFPYVAIHEKTSGMELYKKTYRIGRLGFIDMIVLVFIIVCLNALTWSMSTNGLRYFDLHNDFLTILLLRQLINGFILPYFVIVVTLNYYDWDTERKKEIQHSLRLN